MNATGHWLAAQQVLIHWGVADDVVTSATSAEDLLARLPAGDAILKLSQQRQRLLKDAWLTDVGHLRPGMKAGLPLAEAQQQAKQLGEQIRKLANVRPTR